MGGRERDGMRLWDEAEGWERLWDVKAKLEQQMRVPHSAQQL